MKNTVLLTISYKLLILRQFKSITCRKEQRIALKPFESISSASFAISSIATATAFFSEDL